MNEEYKETGHGNLWRAVNPDEKCGVSYNPSNYINLSGRSETAFIYTPKNKGQQFLISYGDKRHLYADCKTRLHGAIIFLDALNNDQIECAFWCSDLRLTRRYVRFCLFLNRSKQ